MVNVPIHSVSHKKSKEALKFNQERICQFIPTITGPQPLCHLCILHREANEAAAGLEGVMFVG